MEALFERLRIDAWLVRVRKVLGLKDAADMATGYGLMSQGSAPGTFHDLIVSSFNRHPVTEPQEPWINELLTTFQAIAEVATEAVAGQGRGASMPIPARVAARRYPGLADKTAAPDRDRVTVYSFVCSTCGSRYLLDTAVAQAAARRWALDVAPEAIEGRRSPGLVATAFDPDQDAAARHLMEAVRPAADALGLVVIRRPYNRPGGDPDDRCPVCGADTWRPVPLKLEEDPVRFIFL
jgi:hypothetical protein